MLDRLPGVMLLAILSAGAWILPARPAAAETRKLPVTRDLGICAHPSEQSYSPGGSSRARIKHIQHYYLFDFDAEKVVNWKIDQAVLHIRQVRGRMKRVALCTVPVDWVEGNNPRMRPSRGASCFTHRVWPDSPWGHDEANILQVTFNNPRMLWRGAPVRATGDGWLQIPLDAKLVRAVALGLSHGLLLGEDAGQTMANHDIFTREQNNSAPWIEIRGKALPARTEFRPPRPAPKAEPFAQLADFETGAVRIDPAWPGQEDWAHRILLVRDGKTARQVVAFGDEPIEIAGLAPGRYELQLTSFVGPDAAQARPVAIQTSNPQAKPRANPVPAATGLQPIQTIKPGWTAGWVHTAAMPSPSAVQVANPLDQAPVTARNAWASLGVLVAPPDGKAADLKLHVGPLIHSDRSSTRLATVRAFRVWPVGKEGGAKYEVAVPLKAGQPFAIPWQRAKIAQQKNQLLWIDIWVPGQAKPGTYQTPIRLQAGEAVVAQGTLRLEVAPAVCSDTFHVVGDMNTYSSPTILRRSRQDTEAFLAAERAYYRLAHAHRMTLNVLPYNQAGEIQRTSSAPRLTGRGKDRRVADWSAWERRYGPLLSGQAFAKETGYVGPGAGRPIHHIYLPLHENWPVPLAEHFEPWPPPKDYQTFLEWTRELPPIDKSLDNDFQAAWVSVLNQFGRHLAEKGWTGPRYQVYLNNKHLFRRAQWGRGISLWLLDEPMFAIDFEALAFFGKLTARAKQDIPNAIQIDYRVDLSRPGYQRDWLDGLVDLNVTAGQMQSQHDWLSWRRRRFGERYWEYAMPPSFSKSNAPWAAWPIQAYCWGAVGTLPWQTIANDGDFRKADATALMYRGGYLGLDGPLASIRMKAWRQGLQDAELLRQLREKRDWSDLQLREWVRQVAELPDADFDRLRWLSPERLDRLRRAAMAELTGQ